jgi:hypothetical protein
MEFADRLNYGTAELLGLGQRQERLRLAPATVSDREARRLAVEHLRPLNQGLQTVGSATNFLKLCKEKAEGDTRSSDMLVNVDKDGAVKEVLLHSETKISHCLRETMLKDTFSLPPKPAYWVDIHIDVKH